MRDGMSTAKTNKMKSSITGWDRVSYGVAPNEKNRPSCKNGISPPTWQCYDWNIPSSHHQRPLLHFLVFCLSTIQQGPNLMTKQRMKSKNIPRWTMHIDMCHHKHFTALYHHTVHIYCCVGQLEMQTWQGCSRKSKGGSPKTNINLPLRNTDIHTSFMIIWPAAVKHCCSVTKCSSASGVNTG